MPQVQRAPLQVGARRRRRRRRPSARPGEPSLLPCTMRILNIPGQFCLASCRKLESTTEPCTSTFQFPKPSLSACPRHRENPARTECCNRRTRAWGCCAGDGGVQARLRATAAAAAMAAAAATGVLAALVRAQEGRYFPVPHPDPASTL